MNEQLRIPKHEVPVEIRDGAGEVKTVVVFLAEGWAAEARRERLQDVLLERRFIPVKAGGETYFLSQRDVLWVKLDLISALDELDLEAEGAEGSVSVGVRIHLDDGTSVDGSMRYLRPAESRRLSDHLEALPPFFTVRTPDWLYLVNRERVLRVVAVDEVKAPSAREDRR